MIKKVISLILLFFILFVSNGYFLYFKYLQYSIRQEVREEIKNGLKGKDLPLIIVSPAKGEEIVWTEKGKEFKYKGSMYDIAKTQIKNGKKYYYCINDVKEKNLISNFLTGNKKTRRHFLLFQKVLNNKYLAGDISTQTVPVKYLLNFPRLKTFYYSVIIGNIYHPPQTNFHI